MMSLEVQSVILLCLFVIGLLLSKYGYRIILRLFTKNKLKQLGYKLEDVQFSFDRMVYTISLPTNQPDIIRAAKENFAVKEEYNSWIYPQLIGSRVVLQPVQGHDQLIAYLPVEQFRLPLLDNLLMDGKITEEDYRRISECKLILPLTKAEIIDEVYTQIHNKRFS